MKLRFYARPERILSVPAGSRYQGQAPGRIGRGAECRALEEAYEVDSGSATGKEIVRVCRQSPNDPPVYAADEDTASYVGMPFVQVTYNTECGEWLPSPDLATGKKGK